MSLEDEFLEGRNDKCAPIHAKCCVEKNDRKKKFHRLVFLLSFSKDVYFVERFTKSKAKYKSC